MDKSYQVFDSYNWMLKKLKWMSDKQVKFKLNVEEIKPSIRGVKIECRHINPSVGQVKTKYRRVQIEI